MKMKKILIMIILLFIPFLAQAESLICDIPPLAVTKADIEITRNGTVQSYATVTPTVSGTYLVLQDVSNLPPGKYIFRARFIGEGGLSSDWSDPFSARKPENPANVRIE